MKCKYCYRQLSNKFYRTKNGCIWCDFSYRLKKLEKSKFPYKGIIAFDFDSVIASYKRPFKFDKFGKPQKQVIEVMQYFMRQGYYVLIFTGRKKTKKMEEWLKSYKICYNGFNVQPRPLKDADNYKPFYDVFVDDKTVNYHWKYNKKSTEELIADITLKLTWSKGGKDE